MTTLVTDLVAALHPDFPGLTERASLDHPAFTIGSTEVVALLQRLRDAHGYDLLADLTAIDWATSRSPRFTVVYHLFSTERHDYVRVAADCPGDEEPTIPTVSGLWAGADWHERECFDMFGIQFTGHPDLRRILMWDGYPYHPLRKEFPLAGQPTELPDEDIATETGTKVIAAPMAGGPFVAHPDGTVSRSEPRALDQSWNERQEKPPA
jgi:NADH-quinone oxidoreductase subunit C